MNKTAVEWLFSSLDALDEQMKVAPKTLNYKSTKESIIKQAKEMEKQQMINFADDYVDNCVVPNENMAIPTTMDVPQYYNQTYGGKNE